MSAKIDRQRRLIWLGNLQAHRSGEAFRSRTYRQLSILFSDVCLGSMHGFGVENGHAKLANGLRRKANPAFNSAEKRQTSRFPEALIVDAGVPVRFPKFADCFAH